AGMRNLRIQRTGRPEEHEELIDLPQRSGATDPSQDKELTIKALASSAPEGKQDLNSVGVAAVGTALTARDPLHVAPQEYDRLARRILDFRDRERHGLLTDL